MKRFALLLALLAIGLPAPSGAQAPATPPAGAVFAPLDLPTPTPYRLASGEPGPAYWQQRADYSIRATLDPDLHRLTGTVVITYTNNAPDSLGALWLQLDQNLFRPGSRGATLQQGESRWRGAFEGGGYTLSRIDVVRDGRRTSPRYLVDDTRLRIDLSQPLPPGGAQLQVEIDYGFTIPEYGADRMGRLAVEGGTVYEMAQWYPRLYVYDDVHGWNPLPYLGQGEFYLEFGTFDVALTVPRDYLVVATGSLVNPEEVLTAEQQARLARARTSAETVTLVGRDEIGQPGARPDGTGPLTWRYHAERVRDFAWAASSRFIWDAAAYRDVLVQSAYPPEGLGTEGNPGWEHATQYGRHAIAHYSETWFPYPYPVAISVAGIVGGMEYPMIQFSSVRARDQGLLGVVDHELGHNWFPMIVASDERRHAWMDEGFNTFINYYSNVDFYGEEAQRTARLSGDYIAERMRPPEGERPIYTYPDRLPRSALGFLAYRKPGMGLRLLREVVLGPERFDEAFKAYIQRWAYKHPQPADFFRTIEDVAGEDLAWFWRGWFLSTDALDQAVAAVTTRRDTTTISVANRGGLVMPARVAVTFADGTAETLHVPVEAWTTTDTFDLVVPRGDVRTVTLDPEAMLPDVDRANNTWRAGARRGSPSGGSRR